MPQVFYFCYKPNLMQLFIIDWTKEESTPLLEYCKATAHKVVGTELKDGGEAYRKVAGCHPDAIVVNYAKKPYHGRVTALEIRKRKATSLIPIYFIDGEEEENELAENIGICLSSDELKDLLE